MLFNKVLVANRGEIAVRIIKTLARLGVGSVAVYSEADRDSPHVHLADEAVAIGPAPARDSYLQGARIIAAARRTGAGAIIPGYGFLSENAGFAEQCAAVGLVFIGPTPRQIRDFGLKHTSRELAHQAGVPLTPGTGLLADVGAALVAAEHLGYPVMLKSTAGGGGIGMTRCDDAAQLAAAFDTVQRQALNYFGNSELFLERYIASARHIEVQIFGDGRGTVIALGERDCSLQRRNQKVVEETPAPGISPARRQSLLDAALSLGRSVGYQSAGTVEFIYDTARDDFYFLEVNTRLQVEHPITEMVTGIDLVEWMVRTAAGDPPDFAQLAIRPVGAAMEVRIYAEDPANQFLPSPGTLTRVRFPADIRLDGWVGDGTVVSPHYDPMLAKLIVHGHDRIDALLRLRRALEATRLEGIATNLAYLRQVVHGDLFTSGQMTTRALDSFVFSPPGARPVPPTTLKVLQAAIDQHLRRAS